jgi:hypothetical protein
MRFKNVVRGPGPWSVDALLQRWRGSRREKALRSTVPDTALALMLARRV